jgi:hypothetical protein
MGGSTFGEEVEVENKFGGWECSSGRRGGRVGTLGTWDDRCR